MNKIISLKDLQASIKQLETEIKYRDLLIRAKISALKESMQPANIFAGAFNKITGGEELKVEYRHSLSAKVIKTGLMLWLRKLLYKAEEKVEQNVYDSIDTGFDHLKHFMKKKL